MGRNYLPNVLAARQTAGTRDRGGTSLHRSAELGFLLFRFASGRSSRRGVGICPPELASVCPLTCMITAICRAMATIARFIPRWRAIFMPQALSHDHLMVQVSMTWAASNSVVRTIAFPHFEMLPILSISPDAGFRHETAASSSWRRTGLADGMV